MKRSKSRSIFVGFLSVAVFLGVLSNLIIQDVYACPTDNICLDDCTGELIFVSADSDCPPGSHPDTDGWAAPSMGFSSGSPEYNSIEGAYQITIAVSGGRRNSSTIMFLCSQETTDATHKYLPKTKTIAGSITYDGTTITYTNQFGYTLTRVLSSSLQALPQRTQILKA